MGKSLSEIHDEAQKDRADGNGYNIPHGVGESLVTWKSSTMKEHAAENSAYRSGWKNADKQAK